MIILVLSVIVIVSILIWIDEYKKTQDRKLLQTVTTLDRGTASERALVLKLLKYGIPAESIFHDLYLKMDNGQFSQIDVAVITDVGIIVCEVKDYSGWIFGSWNKSSWTQVLAYGREKYSLYSPIQQNYNHIQNLKRQIGQFENIPFYSYIVFYGNCSLRDIDSVPKWVFVGKSENVLSDITWLFHRQVPIQYRNKNRVINLLKQSVLNGESKETQIQHVENIRYMLKQYRKSY